jgi:hypothetical protein
MTLRGKVGWRISGSLRRPVAFISLRICNARRQAFCPSTLHRSPLRGELLLCIEGEVAWGNKCLLLLPWENREQLSDSTPAVAEGVGRGERTGLIAEAVPEQRIRGLGMILCVA